MTQSAWRIAADTSNCAADDLSGAGAKTTGGRWNAVGTPVVYASTHRSLACLETLVHLNSGGLPFNRYLVAIVIPDAVWRNAEQSTPADLPVGWDAEPASLTSINHGQEWLISKRSALLMVPSAIVPEEFNVLINPAHPDVRGVTAKNVRKWIFDPRFAA